MYFWFLGEMLGDVAPDAWFKVELVDHDFFDVMFCELINKFWYVLVGECRIDGSEEYTGFNAVVCKESEGFESFSYC